MQLGATLCVLQTNQLWKGYLKYGIDLYVFLEDFSGGLEGERMFFNQSSPHFSVLCGMFGADPLTMKIVRSMFSEQYTRVRERLFGADRHAKDALATSNR